MSVDNEAACEALKKGTAKNKVALTLAYAMWAVAARYDAATCVVRVPTKLRAADLL